MPYIPITPPEVENEALLPLAQIKLLTVMHWPHDLRERQRFLALTAEPALEKRVLEFGEPPFADQSFLMQRGPRADPMEIIRQRLIPVVGRPAKAPDAHEMADFQVCGQLLLEALDLEDAGQDVTLGRCQQRLSDRLRHSTSARPRDLAKSWMPYKCVAGFHAAEILLMRQGYAVHSSSSFRRLLFLGDQFQRRGEAILVRNVGPLLDQAHAWKVRVDALNSLISDHQKRGGTEWRPLTVLPRDFCR